MQVFVREDLIDHKSLGQSRHAPPGPAEIQISGQKYRIREEETITMPANQPHAIKAASNFKMLLVMIKA
jgi:quercetin dioxygenase-like cupin family protein